jgi:hypothetical protein
VKPAPALKPAKRRGRPKKGESRPKEPTRIERQLQMNELSEMIADLPRACDVGTKRDSQGHQHSWVGYKLHWDVADGGIPIAAILTSASEAVSFSVLNRNGQTGEAGTIVASRVWA